MKHAYLILAHNEFEMLRRLIQELDEPDNDVYVHIDGKVDILPSLTMNKGKLTVLKSRIMTYWGGVSLIKAELLLLKTAFDSDSYDFFHIISGTHFPIMSQEQIDNRFSLYVGKSVLQPAQIYENEVRMKMGKYHFFIKNQTKLKNFLWRLTLRMQDYLPSRDTGLFDFKASQWCSLYVSDVKKILANEKALLRKVRRTFCCDEFFMPAALKYVGSSFIQDSKMLYLEFNRANPRFLGEHDYQAIMESGCMFARKFNAGSFNLIDRICKNTHS